MGGIDLSDMLVHMYKTPVKSRRWYLPLFGYILDLCISNAWLVYKRDCSLLKKALLPLKKFRLAVAHTLAQVNKPASKVGRPSLSSPPQMSSKKKKSNTPRPSHPQPDVQYDNIRHCHYSLTSGGDATSVQRECRDGNARNVMYSCV